jgi:hypothetical protein
MMNPTATSPRPGLLHRDDPLCTMNILDLN